AARRDCERPAWPRGACAGDGCDVGETPPSPRRRIPARVLASCVAGPVGHPSEQLTTPRVPGDLDHVLAFGASRHSKLVRNLRRPCHMPTTSCRVACAVFGVAVGCLLPSAAPARDPGEPIRATYTEGDLAGWS